MHVSLLDVYQPRRAWVHALDPRVKILATLGFILTAVTLPEGAWISYALLYVLILALAWSTELGVAFMLRRGVIALPFVLAALPLPFLTPGEVIYKLPLLGWTMTDAGSFRFLSILLRTWVAVQAAVILSATTTIPDILWGLERLKVPGIIVATIGLMVRYLFVLADEAVRMVRARTSRSPKIEGVRPPGVIWQGGMAGMMVGSLFLRSLERSERVYAAMLARGYDGEMRTFDSSNISSRDWVALGMSVLILAGIFALGVYS
ncbi:MAG: cobalt ECF transporter T component CbiQ [Anaerolineales bacterium]|jgi:cobalt/nickel transport system permease protein